MKILLVSATKFEISPLLAGFKKRHVKGFLPTYRIGKHSVDVLITGVGMTATAFQLGKNLSNKYDLAINAGIAGSFKKNISLGMVVNVVSDCFADLGAEDGERFLTLEEMGIPEAISDKLEGIRKGLKTVSDLPQVKAITVNTVHGKAVSIKKVVKKFNPDIESMEGAAFFYACGEFKTPCIQIRAISNYVERRNKKNWKLGPAASNLNTFLEQLLVSA